MYVVINKFSVEPKHHRGFLKETKTIWIKAYKTSPGFVKTLILKSNKNGKEFLTIDAWKSKKYADKFFAKNLDKLLKASDVPKRCVSRKSYNSL